MADNNETKNDKPTIPADQAPCGVPGYDLTAGEYAAVIQHHVTKGHFFLAMTFMEAANQAKVLGRIELAAQQFFNIEPM